MATALSADDTFMVKEADGEDAIARVEILRPFKYGHRMTHSATTHRATNHNILEPNEYRAGAYTLIRPALILGIEFSCT